MTKYLRDTDTVIAPCVLVSFSLVEKKVKKKNIICVNTE